jgi:hypothetical protein
LAETPVATRAERRLYRPGDSGLSCRAETGVALSASDRSFFRIDPTYPLKGLDMAEKVVFEVFTDYV